MGEDPREPRRWIGPDGLSVRVVSLTGTHRLWAMWAGVADHMDAAFLVTRRAALVGRGYYAGPKELADVVDLASLTPD